MSKVLIIGAGISGLSTAYELQKKGASVVILDKAHHAGGVMQSTSEQGYLSEHGPNSFQLTSETQERWLDEIGLKGEIVSPGPEAKKRFIVRNGTLVAAPMGPGSFIKSQLLSASGKLKLLKEPFSNKKPPESDESVAAFVRRHFGEEVLDYMINPLVSGIYAGDPENLSMRHAFPKINGFAADAGSIVRGAIRARKAQKASGQPRHKSRLISFKSGMRALPSQLASHLGEALELGANIEKIESREDHRWLISWSTQQGTQSETFDRVISTCPVHALSQLPWPQKISNDLCSLQSMPHPSLSALYLGYKREDVAHPLDGFGALIPAKENRKLLGVLFSSSLFPERAPDGHVALTLFIGGTRQPEFASLSKEALIDLVTPDLKDLLGITVAPTYAWHRYWERAIPQYNTGHQASLDCIQKVETENRSLHFVGNFRGGVSVGNCIDNGIALANTLSS